MIRCVFVLLLLYAELSTTNATRNVTLSSLEQYDGVKYLAYTKTNKTNAVDIRDVNFDDDYGNVFIIHGFQAKSLDKSAVKVKNEVFQFNSNVERVIIVSWLEYSRSSVSYAYQQVVQKRVPRLAQDLYQKIRNIRKSGARGTIELIGHSIGAHVAGQTGRLLKRYAGFQLDQIIGLDPVGIFFKGHKDFALQNGDAKKVVVLHTNINTYGFGSQIGPNDKLVNGGVTQPNCKIDVNKCSHYEAWNSFLPYARSRLEANYETDGVIEAYKPVRSFANEQTEITNIGSEEVIQFTVDDKSGNTAAVFSVISHDLHKFDVELTSPSGSQFLSSSPQYFSNDLTEKGFRIKNAEPGQWNLTVVKYSKHRPARSPISIIAVSRQVDASSEIKLVAEKSDTILKYPKPITIQAQLNFHEFPIVHAEVFAEISSPEQTVHLPLYDDGIYPDELQNDGIYTNDIVKLPHTERYSITVKALSNSTAMSPMKEINYLLRDAINCKETPQDCEKMSEFEREAELGSVKLVSKKGEDKIPPHPVSDLRGVINATEKIAWLEWTSPRNDDIRRYDIRILVNGTDFEKGVKVFKNHIISGTLKAVLPANSEKISIRIPRKAWNFMVAERFTELKFALKSIGYNNEFSDISNIASVSTVELTIKEYNYPPKEGCKTLTSNYIDYEVRALFC